jgi:branched-chain amino acid transport system permease protein
MVLVVVLVVLSFAGTADAQDEGAGFVGTITAATEEGGEKIAVEGVVITVVDADGNEAGDATTAEDGTWAVEGLGSGTYTVSIDPDSLPDGTTLNNPDRASLELDLGGTQNRTVLFAVAQGDAGSGAAGDSFFDRAARLAVQGLIFGLVIAMCSIGLSLIFGTTGLVNFAHGELVTFGALIALFFNDPDTFGLSMLLAAPLAVIVSAGGGWASEAGLWRPLRNRGTGLIAMMVVSIGLSIVLRYIYLYIAGGRRVAYTDYAVQRDGLELGPVTIVPRELWIIGLSVLVLVLVALAVQRTRMGKAMRAVSDNRDLAESSGIDVERVIKVVWIGGAALAGLGGVFFGLNQGVSWDMGFELLLLMFAAVTLGGLGTAYGPLFGSLIVGMFINLSTLWVAPELKNIGALVILVVILMVRPQGLFGQKERIG